MARQKENAESLILQRIQRFSFSLILYMILKSVNFGHYFIFSGHFTVPVSKLISSHVSQQFPAAESAEQRHKKCCDMNKGYTGNFRFLYALLVDFPGYREYDK